MAEVPVPDMKVRNSMPHGAFANYVAGFVLSVALTLVAYVSVVHDLFDRQQLVAIVVGLAVVQFVVQMVFFLHLGREARPKWNLLVFCFMVIVLGILVWGTLWIMHNLDYNMMPPEQLEQHIVEDEGYHH